MKCGRKRKKTFEDHSSPIAAALCSDRRFLGRYQQLSTLKTALCKKAAASPGSDGDFLVWNLRTGSCCRFLPVGETITCLSIAGAQDPSFAQLAQVENQPGGLDSTDYAKRSCLHAEAGLSAPHNAYPTNTTAGPETSIVPHVTQRMSF